MQRARDITERLRIVAPEEAILHGAVAVFGKRLAPQSSQWSFRLARFKGMDRTLFLDRKQDLATAFQIIREAAVFIRRNTKPAAIGAPERLTGR